MHVPGMLDSLIADWTAKGWSLDDLAAFRMEADDGLDGLDEDERAELEALSEDDQEALRSLTPEDIEALTRSGGENDPNSVDYWKKRSRLNERDAKKAKRELDRLRNAPPPKKDDSEDDQPDLDKLRAEAKAEAEAELLRGRVEDKIEAKARAFADPEDAVAVLLRSYEIDDFIDDGKVDVAAITEALEDLGKKKPHLLAEGKRFKGGADGGARNDSKPGQLTQADLKSMSPEEIVKAKAEGRLNDLLGRS